MRPDDLRTLLQATPFRPFRLVMLDQTTYEVRHPEQLLVGRSTVTVHLKAGLLPTSGPLEVIASLLHIIRIEILRQPKAVGSNGG